MSGSYSQIFGGETVNPTQLSYIRYDVDENLTLVWPFEAPPDANAAADKLDIYMATPGTTVIMPPANQISVGQDVLIRNVGIINFVVHDADGTEIGAVAPGEAWYFVVTDNTTEAGEWYAIEFGVGTSSATAASLAGYGLRARANILDQDLPTLEVPGDRTIQAVDRARVLQSIGGTVSWFFESATTMGNGFFVYIINSGTGTLTLDPTGGETIDGDATKVIAPGESLIVFGDNFNFHTLGYGRAVINSITATSINVAGTGTTTLTLPQRTAQIQDYVGTLTGNRIVEYSGAVGFWMVYNNTAGAFALTLRADSLDVGAVIPQGFYSIVRNNGTNIEVAFTASSGTVTSITAGTGLTGGVITTSGTIGLANTTVVAGAYGSASRTLTATVDAQGRLTAMAQPSIAITASQVTDLSTLLDALVLVLEPVASVKPWAVTAIPAGWLLMSGATIGNAASGASARANADTGALFTALWDSYTNTVLPMLTSGGVPVARGATAADDFAANRRLPLPDMRGRVWVGRDNMGGAAASRITTTMTPNGNTMGATGGAQTATLVEANLAVHNHTVNITDPGHRHSYNMTTASAGASDSVGGPVLAWTTTPTFTTTITTGITAASLNTGSGTAFDKTQPGFIGNWIMKYA